MTPTDDPAVRAARAKVRARPPLDRIEPVGQGEESVWRYPRPPRLETSRALIEIFCAGKPIVRTDRAWRVIETSSPPVYYVPIDAIAGTVTDRTDQALCEWKGHSTYIDLEVAGTHIARAGWRFHHPFDDLGQGYTRLVGLVALLPALFDCRVDGVRAEPQVGGYYGGWITSSVKGPFKGGEGTQDW